MNTNQDLQKQLPHDPIPVLLASGNKAIIYFTRRDLMCETPAPIQSLWEIPEAVKFLRRQQMDGSWKYPGKDADPNAEQNYNQLETFRNLGELVEKYGLNSDHPAVKTAAHYLFSCQTEEGDFRGIYGTQYAPNYSGAIMEILIKAGYHQDPRIEKGVQWLLSMRQADGGWAAPLRTLDIRTAEAFAHKEPLQPDRSKPSSHLMTGMILRAFAAHPDYRHQVEATAAGKLLLSRLFKPDSYVDRRNASYWERVSFPFWFTDIVSALDSLSKMGFSIDDPDIKTALERLARTQLENGLFELKLLRTRDKDTVYWVTLAICRVFERFFHNP
jgi:hypothetical protein